MSASVRRVIVLGRGTAYAGETLRDSRPRCRSPCGLSRRLLESDVRVVLSSAFRQPMSTFRIASWLFEATPTRWPLRTRARIARAHIGLARARADPGSAEPSPPCASPWQSCRPPDPGHRGCRRRAHRRGAVAYGQKIVDGREPARPALITDHVAQGVRDDAGLDRPVRVQRQPVASRSAFALPTFTVTFGTGDPARRCSPGQVGPPPRASSPLPPLRSFVSCCGKR